jgi:hypothetical protein
MTTNERLYIAGLLDRFDVAVKSRNRSEMIQLLKQANIPDADATSITNEILVDPGRYGY